MTACCQKNPIEQTLFINNIIENYMKEYYKQADIDIVIITQDPETNYDFINKANILIKQLNINLCKIKNINNSLLEIIINATIFITLSKEIIENELLYNYDQFIKNKFSDDIINLIKTKYEILINNVICNFKLNNINYKINIDNHQLNIPKIHLAIKYNISSEYLLHPLEIFNIHNKHINEIVSNFHLPCVRGYYDGENVFLFPSMISALLTRLNIDYKYISSKKSPLEIIQKNRNRGFGTLLNTNEKYIMTNYIKNNLILNKLYLNNYGTLLIFSPINLDSKLIISHTNNIPLPINYNKFTSITNIIKKYKPIINCNFNNIINYDNLICIDNFGKILPVEKWIINSINYNN
jgi:hypothetical protein